MPAYLVSRYLSQSIWGERHLIFILWPLLVVFAETVWKLRPASRAVAMMLVAVWATVAFSVQSRVQRKIPWDTITVAMLDQEQGSASRIPVYSVDPYLHYPIWFYLESLKNG